MRMGEILSSGRFCEQSNREYRKLGFFKSMLTLKPPYAFVSDQSRGSCSSKRHEKSMIQHLKFNKLKNGAVKVGFLL